MVNAFTRLCAKALKPIMLATATFMLLLSTSTASVAAEAKILIAYFSYSGNTQAVAEKLATELGSDVYRIQAKEEYNATDLSNEPNSRTIQEKNHPEWRPAIVETNANVGQYDTILIGYPIWS